MIKYRSCVPIHTRPRAQLWRLKRLRWKKKRSGCISYSPFSQLESRTLFFAELRQWLPRPKDIRIVPLWSSPWACPTERLLKRASFPCRFHPPKFKLLVTLPISRELFLTLQFGTCKLTISQFNQSRQTGKKRSRTTETEYACSRSYRTFLTGLSRRTSRAIQSQRPIF